MLALAVQAEQGALGEVNFGGLRLLTHHGRWSALRGLSPVCRPIMANLRRRIPQQTESLFVENHRPFFNSIDPLRQSPDFVRCTTTSPLKAPTVDGGAVQFQLVVYDNPSDNIIIAIKGSRPAMHGYSFRALAVSTTLLAVSTICQATAADTPEGRACRAAAAYKVDGGVDFDKLVAKSAIAICENAMVKDPNDLFILAYYGRALLKAERKVEALRMVQKSADGGNPMGLRMLGNAYENGDGVPANKAKGVALYRQAAEQGFTWAEFDLGRVLLNGIGVQEDDDEAARWLQKAAEVGLTCPRRYWVPPILTDGA